MTCPAVIGKVLGLAQLSALCPRIGPSCTGIIVKARANDQQVPKACSYQSCPAPRHLTGNLVMSQGHGSGCETVMVTLGSATAANRPSSC